MRTHTKETRAGLSPADVLRTLLNGNERFANNMKANRDLQQQVQSTASGLFPWAVVLSCMDSRTSAELIFDQGLGDIFSIRIAGNIVSPDILGSIEYAVAAADVKLVVVLGHTACGAVAGACEKVRMGNLTATLERIAPAVGRVSRKEGEHRDFKDQVAAANVCVSIETMMQQSPIIRQRMQKGDVGVAGAMYDVYTGRVEVIHACAYVREAAPRAAELGHE